MRGDTMTAQRKQPSIKAKLILKSAALREAIRHERDPHKRARIMDRLNNTTALIEMLDRHTGSRSA